MTLVLVEAEKNIKTVTEQANSQLKSNNLKISAEQIFNHLIFDYINLIILNF